MQEIAQKVVDEMFGTSNTVDTGLDQTVVSLSQDLIDDYPASDPRWAENRQGLYYCYTSDPR